MESEVKIESLTARITEVRRELYALERELHMAEKEQSERQKEDMRKRKAELLQRRKVEMIGYVLRQLDAAGIDMGTIRSRDMRRGRVFFARVAVTATLRRNGYTLSEIGAFVNRNHATVIYYLRAYARIKENPKYDRAMSQFIGEFDNDIKQ